MAVVCLSCRFQLFPKSLIGQMLQAYYIRLQTNHKKESNNVGQRTNEKKKKRTVMIHFVWTVIDGTHSSMRAKWLLTMRFACCYKIHCAFQVFASQCWSSVLPSLKANCPLNACLDCDMQQRHFFLSSLELVAILLVFLLLLALIIQIGMKGKKQNECTSFAFLINYHQLHECKTF